MTLRGVARAAYRSLPGKQPVYEVLRRVLSLPEPLYRHLHFEGAFRVRGAGGGFRMLHPGSQLENELFWSGLDGWEPEAVAVWVALAGEASCVLDVGAHSGLFAFVAWQANPAATVVAFEPVSEVFGRLETNNRLNGDPIRCVRAAASDTSGSAVLHQPTGPSPLSASLKEGFLPGVSVRAETVRTVTLDGFAEAEALRPDLIKLDVEGHEPAALAGARRVMEAYRPAMLVEVLDPPAAEAVEAAVRGLAYDAFDLVPDGESTRLDRPWRPGTKGNLLLLPRGRSLPSVSRPDPAAVR